MISYPLIKKTAQKIGEILHPKKIILFGSYCNGNPKKDSDVDLLVVLSEKHNSSKKYTEISKILEPRHFPMDLLIHTTKEINKRIKMGDTFIKDILENGKVLYGS